MGVKVTKVGDWLKAKEILGNPGLGPAIQKALRQEGQYIAGLIKTRLGSGNIAPPLSPLTVAMRKGKGAKPLNATGALRNGIFVEEEQGSIFIGVKREAKGVDIASVHEFGAVVVLKMTDRMRRFLFGVLFPQALKKRMVPFGPRARSGKGFLVIRIPARPFMRPVFETEAPRIPERFMRRVCTLLGGKFGRL